jgi:hypothetical protein
MERNMTSLLPPVKVPPIYETSPSLEVSQTIEESPQTYVEPPPSGHVEAGKKAATSVKGSQWLREVEVAFDEIRARAQQEGLDAKLITRQEATKIASAQRKSLNADAIAENILNRLRKPEEKKNKKKTQKKNRRRNNLTMLRQQRQNTRKRYGDE